MLRAMSKEATQNRKIQICDAQSCGRLIWIDPPLLCFPLLVTHVPFRSILHPTQRRCFPLAEPVRAKDS